MLENGVWPVEQEGGGIVDRIPVGLAGEYGGRVSLVRFGNSHVPFLQTGLDVLEPGCVVWLWVS